ncbi:hypothetical protein Ahia01_001247400, partial [Argonauta hians]
MTTRRAKIQIKPKIVPGISKRERNGADRTSKEVSGEHSSTQGSNSGPSTETQSSCKPQQQQSVFSLRSKPGLRGSVAPRLHGSMDSVKHIPTLAAPAALLASDENQVSPAEQSSNSTKPSTEAPDQCKATAADQQGDTLSTPSVTSGKEVEKQAEDKTIKEEPCTVVPNAESAQSSSGDPVKDVEKSSLTSVDSSKPDIKPVITRRSRFSVQPKIRPKAPSLSNGSNSSDSQPAVPLAPKIQQPNSRAIKTKDPMPVKKDSTEIVVKDTKPKVEEDGVKLPSEPTKTPDSKVVISKPSVDATTSFGSVTGHAAASNDATSAGSSKITKDASSASQGSTVSNNSAGTAPADGKDLRSSAPSSSSSSSSKPAANVPAKVITRRSRFALQPNLSARPNNRPNSRSVPQVKPTVRFQEPEKLQQLDEPQLPEHILKLSQEKTVELSTVVVFDDGKQCEVTETKPISVESKASASPKIGSTVEVCSSSRGGSREEPMECEDVTDSVSLKKEPIEPLKSADEATTITATTTTTTTTTPTATTIKSQEIDTKSPVPRRSKFQVRPKLGASKRPESVSEEAGSQESKTATKRPANAITTTSTTSTSTSTATTSTTTTTTTKAVKSEGSTGNFTKLVNTDQDPSITDPTPPKVARTMKDTGVMDNNKVKEFPVTLPKSPAKARKALPLREKQKKPDLSEHPADKPPDRSKMRMRDLIYWNPLSSPMKSPEKKTTRTVRLDEEAPAVETQSNENEPVAVPQVKIGADGNIVINEESLVISNSQQSAPICSETVDETDTYSNYGSFRKYTPKSKWSLKETKKFFLALSTVGTDFSLMSNLFPNKTRRDLKNKFKREERKNRWLIDKAIKQQLHFDEQLFEEKSESEEEVEVPAKKPKAEKVTKPKKNNKAANTPKRKQKKASKKDYIIESQAGSSPSTEEVVVEEAVQDELIVLPDNGTQDAGTATGADTSSSLNETSNGTGNNGNRAKRAKNTTPRSRMPKNAAKGNKNTITTTNTNTTTTNTTTNQRDEAEVVSILMELGRSGPTGQSNNASGQSNVVVSGTTSNSVSETPRKTAAGASAGVAATAAPPPAAARNLLSGAPADGGRGGVLKDNSSSSSSLARTFLQQMGLNQHINTLQDEIVSITEAEITNDNSTQKVILVEVRPKNQQQTVVHMYLVSPGPRTAGLTATNTANNTSSTSSSATASLPAPSMSMAAVGRPSAVRPGARLVSPALVATAMPPLPSQARVAVALPRRHLVRTLTPSVSQPLPTTPAQTLVASVVSPTPCPRLMRGMGRGVVRPSLTVMTVRQPAPATTSLPPTTTRVVATALPPPTTVVCTVPTPPPARMVPVPPSPTTSTAVTVTSVHPPPPPPSALLAAAVHSQTPALTVAVTTQTAAVTTPTVPLQQTTTTPPQLTTTTPTPPQLT